MISIICIVLALICFLFAAFGVVARVGWRDLGFAFLVAAYLLRRL